MALTVGTGPFGTQPGGEFNFELPKRRGLIYFESSPRRIRGLFAGETIVDSTNAKLLHEYGHLPLYYFPESEVRMDLLDPTDHRTRCPYKGDASYWSVRVGERVSENGAWSYPEPIDGAPPISGHVAFYWRAMDDWLEEDEPMVGHARDPYTRVDVLDSSRHVRIELAGEAVAETRRPRVIFETGLPPRWYFPPDDVRADALEPSDTNTICAYKGVASYRSVRAGGDVEEDIVWLYEDPHRDVARVKDYLCFFDERCDVYVDGELQERPQTQWSPGRRPHP